MNRKIAHNLYITHSRRLTNLRRQTNSPTKPGKANNVRSYLNFLVLQAGEIIQKPAHRSSRKVRLFLRLAYSVVLRRTRLRLTQTVCSWASSEFKRGAYLLIANLCEAFIPKYSKSFSECLAFEPTLLIHLSPCILQMRETLQFRLNHWEISTRKIAWKVVA